MVLGGRDLIKVFRHFDDRGTLIGEDNFFGGLADLAKAQGFSDADVCATVIVLLFSDHPERR